MSLIGLLVLLAMPAGADAPASVAARPTGQCQVTTAVPVARTRLDRDAEWSARQVLDLQFETRLRSRSEAAQVEFRVYTPGGHLYRKLTTPESALDPSRPGAARRAPSNRARALLPVAGTGIVRNGLYGKWTVVPHLLGEAQPCGRPFTFDLAP